MTSTTDFIFKSVRDIRQVSGGRWGLMPCLPCCSDHPRGLARSTQMLAARATRLVNRASIRYSPPSANESRPFGFGRGYALRNPRSENT